ncbi:MAG: lysophospholipid acyltransferase family protein [Pseudomonadales bacterium]|nr:lysophospholipid acyltransferase family protein [Pseudomonadales bacterium]
MTGTLAAVFLNILSLLPRKVSQILGQIVGRLHYIVDTRAAKITRENIGLCYPLLPESEKDLLVDKSLQHTAQTMFETPAVWLGSRPRLETWIEKVSDESLLNEAKDQGRGVIVLLPHLGNWELFNVYYSRHGKMTALYHPPRQMFLQAVMRDIRQNFGNELVETNVKGVARLYRRLESGGVVTILPDQVPGSGVFSPFFGHEALTDRLIPRLIQKTGARVVAVTVQRLHNGKFTIAWQEPNALVYDQSESLAVEAINKTIESCVALAPSQYQWEYKRFRERPPGQKRLYRFHKPGGLH